MSNSFREQLERHEEKAARELAEAELAAHQAGKEPFDVVVLDTLLGRKGGSSAEQAEEMKEKYYVGHREILTLAEFADLMGKLSMWD